MQVVLKAIMLRRRKDQLLNGKSLIELPQRTVTVVSCPFDSSEQAFYSALENKMGDVVEKLMDKGTNSYISMLVLLLRLRQGNTLRTSRHLLPVLRCISFSLQSSYSCCKRL